MYLTQICKQKNDMSVWTDKGKRKLDMFFKY